MRVVIAEDSAVVRAGLIEILLDRGHVVPAAVSDGDALIEAVTLHRPDVAIIDVRMPPTHTTEGLRAAVALRRTQPHLPLLVFSQHIETRHVEELLSGSASGGVAGVGYLPKDRVADVGEFFDALDRVVAGGTALDPEVIAQVFGASRRSRQLETLTGREREVLAQMAEGRSNTAIAEILVISERAVEKHVSNIFSKFNLPPSQIDHRRVLAVLQYLSG